MSSLMRKKIQDLSARVCEFEREREKKNQNDGVFFLGVFILRWKNGRTCWTGF